MQQDDAGSPASTDDSSLISSPVYSARDGDGQNPTTSSPAARQGELINMIAECYTRRREYFIRTARRIVRSQEDAEDVVQEAFMNAVRYADRYQGQSKLDTWIYSITANTAIEHCRSRLRRKNLEYQARKSQQDIPTRYSPGVEDALIGAERRKELLAAIADVGVGRRTWKALELRYWYGMSRKEIAATTGLASGTISSRLQRGKSMLREGLRGIR